MSDRPQIQLALQTLNAVLHRHFVDQSHLEATPDLRADDGEPTISVEVKRLTSFEFRRVNAQLSDVPFTPSSLLRDHWGVVVNLQILDDELPQPAVPAPPISPAFKKRLESAGFEVDHSPRRRQPPEPLRLGKDFVQELEALLVVLERHDVELTRGGTRYLTTADSVFEGSAALWEFERRTNGGVGLAETATDLRPAGIEILASSGYVRTSQPDMLANRINSFLGSDRNEAKRLRRQLDSVPAGQERHAFLVFDFTDPEFHSWAEWDLNDLPTAPLDLPPMIDRLWLRPAEGDRVWCFDVTHGWQAYQVTQLP